MRGAKILLFSLYSIEKEEAKHYVTADNQEILLATDGEEETDE
ncbi:MAG: hypothetical protein ACLRT4_04760 [Thomasclavelia sp.]